MNATMITNGKHDMDTGDIINFIQKRLFDSILVSFNDGAEPRLLSITSTANVTNAASDTEDSFVSINFTNSLVPRY